MQQQHYDVIIGGGAMNGLTLALALNTFSASKLRIAVIEKRQRSQQQGVGFDSRCVALSDGTCRKLNRIKVNDKTTLWQQIQSFAEPIKQVHVSERGHSGIVEINAEELHLAQLGVVVSLQDMGNTFAQALIQYPNIELFCPHFIEQITVSSDQVKVILDDQRCLTGSILVAADGTDSQLAQLVGIASEELYDFQQSAIIANVVVSEAHQGRAFERFTPEGPIALLPMADKMMSLVFCTKTPETLLALDDQQFLTHLQQSFGWRLGQFKSVSKRYAYPLKVKRSATYVGQRFALVGNAAQTLHPVAGQGFNLGIRDVFALAEAIVKAEDIGSDQMLQQYQAERLQDQQRIIGLTTNLVQIFSNELLPLQVLRHVGLISLSQCATLRHTFVQPTLGRI
ncbi:2-octaprenyl-6-methoxyphenyl hydroxylase [Gallibacterium genomosp. 3]|uniref:2-octaprenyl-6-methoxyphenyl hydroxylase n=1 Tax=Gallibacterium genomosp. 3 TaxID=505345 RepID=A0A1A7PTL0_9PAST|nr:2-octaprenyl-6-methoxyphenyl hydroxylase [Gallibacterium genomosp. 3]OBX05384.1 2-octaprenyl-6-methoxyphenyl hydroxylase [Gallibacterium genomosp. 3]